MGYSQSTLGANGANTIVHLDSDVTEDIYIQVTGVFVGTLTAALSVDGVNYDTLQLVPTNSATAVTSITTTGSWRTTYGVSYGAQFLKITMSPYTSGAAVVNIKTMMAARSP